MKYVIASLLLVLAHPLSAQSLGWPLQPNIQDRPIGNTLGEFWMFEPNKPYQHTGIDILAEPFGAPGAQSVIATTGGDVVYWNSSDLTGWGNEIRVQSADGIVYRYQHLGYESFGAKFMGEYHPGVTVTAGEALAQVAEWSRCITYSHLHYDLLRGGNTYLNPLATIAPADPDGQPPGVQGIWFANRSAPRWSDFAPPSEHACAVVKGNVDIISELIDRDDAGSPLPGAGKVGVYNVRWRVCPKNNPTCTSWNDTHPFAEMPSDWDRGGNAKTVSQFSWTGKWISTSDECSTTVDRGFHIVTGLTATGWKTGSPEYPDGSYSVSVEAYDIAGNKSTLSALACVQNIPGTCATDLMIRDGEHDNGGTPYFGFPFWESPDINVNPTSAFAGTIRESRNNVIEVTVRNSGSCPLPVGTTYQVCLAWSLPSPYIPFPLPAGQTLPCKTETVTASDWAPGTSRTTTFNWQPPGGSVPQGHACLVAWSDATGDPVQTTSTVTLDNNRAQRNITVVEPPSLFSQFARTFYVHHADAMSDRSMELAFRTDDGQPYEGGVLLHIPPTVKVARVSGAQLIGAYRQLRSLEVCPSDDAHCRAECPDPANATRFGCTAVYGHIDDPQRVRLDRVVVEEKSALLLELAGDARLPSRGFIDAHIVESGTTDGRPDSAIGGLTIRFQIPARP
ncbi:MAG TPA: peptidoglycan DD-metalloendopeptidase family protein [Steroidobacteraceae bacterium]|nr:peptidoglycan DD-metalloendopeptidase family protein [Steroidobacteraceae bacterium]